MELDTNVREQGQKELYTSRGNSLTQAQDLVYGICGAIWLASRLELTPMKIEWTQGSKKMKAFHYLKVKTAFKMDANTLVFRLYKS